ncbi:MAG: N-acetylneuraminate synthase family protein [Gammaproteobacteria bacterium]|nr:N-acetylneuraminate synthase family protein [Gammaproteobacteria bacterium]
MKLTKTRNIYNYCEPYIIAELGSNHNGDMELARKLILEAKESGADCVKFQSWSKNTLFARKKFEDNYFLADDYRNRTDYSLEEIVEAYSISEEELLQMKEFSDQVGIDCTSTPFSKSEADFLVDKLCSPFIKVASMDVNNYPFLSYLARKGRPIVLSTGLSELHEIDKAIQSIEKEGNTDIVLLHCVSIYPPKDEQINLNNIDSLQRLYPNYPVGFSDHSLGTSIPLASVAKGACIIEKHFTLDKNMPGWDHKVSADSSEMGKLCNDSKRIARALGTGRISFIEDEERRSEFRRSIVLARNMKNGEIINESDIDYKRPGTGLQPEMTEWIVGQRVNKDLKLDHLLSKEDLN